MLTIFEHQRQDIRNKVEDLMKESFEEARGHLEPKDVIDAVNEAVQGFAESHSWVSTPSEWYEII